MSKGKVRDCFTRKYSGKIFESLPLKIKIIQSWRIKELIKIYRYENK